MNTDNNICIETKHYPISGGIFLQVEFLYRNDLLIRVLLSISKKTPPHLNPCSELIEILKGNITYKCDLSSCSPFQHRVLNETRKIPFGKTLSYKDLAQKIGCPSPRAVGRALRNNPIPLLIPCHRVLKKGGGLGGFSQGQEIKSVLLEFEHESSCNE